MVPYVDVVVAVTVICVLLFVLHVCLLRECDGARLTTMLVWGMVVVSAGPVGGTRGSGIVFSTADMLWISGMRRVGGGCVCVWVGVGGEGGEGMRGLGFGFTNLLGTGGVLDVCLCFGCGGVGGGEWVGGLDQGLEGWGYVCVSCESGFSV